MVPTKKICFVLVALLVLQFVIAGHGNDNHHDIESEEFSVKSSDQVNNVNASDYPKQRHWIGSPCENKVRRFE